METNKFADDVAKTGSDLASSIEKYCAQTAIIKPKAESIAVVFIQVGG